MRRCGAAPDSQDPDDLEDQELDLKKTLPSGPNMPRPHHAMNS